MKVILFVVMIITTAIANADKIPVDPNKIKVMAYNIENLFDWTHDEGKSDETFLPLSEKNTPEHKEICENSSPIPYYINQCLTLDWSPNIVQEKIHRIVNTVAQLSPQGPDILILEEIENQNVLSMLNKGLKGSNYKSQILIEGPDRRGIDVAILTRYPVINQELHLLPTTEIFTRGILQADLKLPTGEVMTVFAVHLPSQANPTKFRKLALETLNQLMLNLPKDRFVIAGGDFNIPQSEEKKEQYFSNFLEQNWDVSHLHSTVPALGTHFYQKKWDFLDAILVKDMSQTQNNRFKPEWNTFRPLSDGFYQLKADGTPARFDFNQEYGVSDHLPVYGEISISPRKTK